jgi:polyisoprenoid-binding protein YceI
MFRRAPSSAALAVATFALVLLPGMSVVIAQTAQPVGPVPGARFQVRPDQDENRVTFRSEAPVESFEGHTGRVQGEFTARVGDLVGPMTGSITVDLASLDTGIGLRNKHMRENHLETDSYPEAVFAPEQVLTSTAMVLTPGLTAQVRVGGQLTLHGVTHPVQADLDVARQPDGSLEVTGGFTVKLSDYQIKRPQFLVMKLADEQKVTLHLRAVPIPAEVP